eukprot:258718_1
MASNAKDLKFLSKDIYNGTMFKRGKINTKWKERHFIVYRSEQRIEYYTSAEDATKKKEILGTIDLSNATKIEVVSNYNITLIRQLPEYIDHNDKLKSDKNFTFQLILDNRTFIFAALNKPLFFEWLHYLKSCLYGAVVKQGWLQKLGAVNKNWKKRYFILNKYQQMKYFEDTQKIKYLGMIDCTDIVSVTNGKIYSNELRYTLELNTKSRIWVIAADDKKERLEWARFINALKRADWQIQLDKMENEEKETINSPSSRYSNASTPKSPNRDSISIRKPSKIIPKLPSEVMAIFQGTMPAHAKMTIIAENVSLKRIVYVLKLYEEYLSQIQNGAVITKTMYCQIEELPNYGLVCLLNDFYYLMMHNDDKFEEIYNLLVQQFGTQNISNTQCQRIYRNRMDMSVRNELYFDEQDSVEICCQQILDRIFCHFFHCFDVGYKLTTIEENELELKQNENENENIKKRMYKLMQSKRINLKSLLGENRYINNKFVHVIASECDEEKKTDIFDINISRNVGNVGVTFYYWEYYKTLKELPGQKDYNRNDHSGYGICILNITPKHGSFKEEIFCYPYFSNLQYKEAIVKTNKYMQAAIVKKTKAASTHSGATSYLKHYGIAHG